MMATRPLGQSGLRVSELGFGAASLGNLYTPITDGAAHDAIEAALAAGLTYIDTAPFYGFGLSERRVGDALRHRPDTIVSSKVGRILDPDPSVRDDRERFGFRSSMPFAPRFNYSYDAVMRSLEASLHRMGRARIDILYVHDIGAMTHGDAAPTRWCELTKGGGLRALEELRDGGVIGAFGIGVNEIPVCLDVMAETRLDAILLAGRYTLLEQGALDALFPACAAAGTAIVLGGPYNSGILATGTRRGGTIHYDYGPAPEPVIARVAAIEAVAERHGVPLPAAALQFVLAHPLVASVIPGLGSAARVRDTVALRRAPIPAAFWAELQHEGLLRADAPIPSPSPNDKDKATL